MDPVLVDTLISKDDPIKILIFIGKFHILNVAILFSPEENAYTFKLGNLTNRTLI
jgi:hypothetical protein